MNIEITPINPLLTIESPQGDENLYSVPQINAFTENSYIQYKIEDSLGNNLFNTYNFTNFSPSVVSTSGSTTAFTSIDINPLEDFKESIDYTSNIYNSTYCFYNKQIGSPTEHLYIAEISSDRTEIRLNSLDLSYYDIIQQTTEFVYVRDESLFFVEFYLSSPNNDPLLANNIKLDNEDVNNPTIIVKLSQPLPSQFEVNDNFWIVTLLEEPISYKITVTPSPIVINDTSPIKGPNFNLDIKDHINNSTLLLSYQDLISTTSTSSLDQLDNLLNQKEISINVDYTDFNNFVFFSSAQTRLENFQSKIKLIENYSSSLAILNNTSTTTNISSSKSSYEGKITEIINNFDGYERFLYYESGSFSYPKTNNQIPYILEKSTSIPVINWLGNSNLDSSTYGGMLSSSAEYDINNRNQLLKSIPEYLRDDPSNQQYELFVDMLAQYYDNIWVYLKDITNKYDNDNRLNFGVSKDLVADAIRDFGIKLYQNSFSNKDLYTAFLGLTPEGGLFPYPNMTGSLPTPTSFEYVNNLISASNDILPQEDVNKSLYKRIYHNLPYLISSKGTIPGLRALITSYGIPDTILRINEYGGKDKINVNDWDHWQNEFNYAFNTSGSNFISSSFELHPSWSATVNRPESLMFRFNAGKLPTTNIPYSQSLWYGDGASGTAVTLTYTGSAYASGSYSGSIINSYYQHATLNFFPDISEPTVSASIYLPFFNGEWWSVMVNWNGGSTWDLFAGSKLYKGGNNNTQIGYFDSSSITGDKTPWINTDISYFPVSFSVGSLGGYDIVTYDDTAIYDGTSGFSSSYGPFSGSYQEIRYYANSIDESVFKDYVMNPYSTEGNSINSSPNELAFRASIGGELYTSSVSIHPKVTGSWITTQSFNSGNSDFYFDSTPNFITNKEFFFVDQPIAGIKNVIGDKIRIENNVFPTGSVLSPYKSLLQQTSVSQSYTPNINYLEVAFSPQNQINEDIMSQIGFFNIGDYIGDPRLRSSSADSYPDLDKLRNEYFQKYIKNYDVKDFIRLIKFFDNSLFKMIKDFVPARTSLASGIVIKQHLLERDKYPTPQPNINTLIAKHATSGSIHYNQPNIQQNILVSGTILPQSRNYNSGSIVKPNGGTGGTLEQFNGLNTSPYGVFGTGPQNIYFLTQSWSESINTLSGSANRIISNQDEFYNGEFSGSQLTVTTQSLAFPYPDNLPSFTYSVTLYSNNYYGSNGFSQTPEDNFLSLNTTPVSGEALLLAPYLETSFIPGSGFSFSTSNPYIKIHKDDCSGIDQSIPLKQADKIVFKHYNTTSYVTYNIESSTEYSTYILYKLKVGDIPLLGTGIYSEVKDYTVSGSSTTITSFAPTRTLVKNYTATSNPLGYLDTTSGVYTPQNTPNVQLDISASITFGGGGTGTVFITTNPSTDPLAVNTGTIIAQQSGAGGTTVLVTSSYYPVAGSTLGIQGSGVGGASFSKATFVVTQSVAVSSSQCVDVFLEPYLTLNNYYNSDFNPTMNNIMDNRKNSIYQDVDYSSGINAPVNFNFLISGSALKFPIPDSHYTQKSSVIPRYEGAKSTSQFLNKWTKGDSGTYAQTPTVDQLKTKIAYADWIGGYPPEHMDASGVHIQYLIDEDGTVKIPNTSENSLEDVQQAFMSGRILELSSNTIGTGQPTPQRDIIRGGYRIEPILYTQSGSAPNAQWTSSITLQDITSNPGGATGNYQVVGTANTGIGYYDLERISITPNPYNANLIGTTNSPSPTGNNYSYYEIPSGVITENVTLNFQYHFTIINDPSLSYTTTNPSNVIGSIGIILKKGATTLQVQTFPVTEGDLVYGEYMVGGNFFLDTTGVSAGDEISFEYALNAPSIWRGQISEGDVYITQTPIPTSTITAGNNLIWGYPDKTIYPNTITSSTAVSSSLGFLYGDDNVKQSDLVNSGFNPISLPWSIEVGDEFRFEGVESNVFMVKKVYGMNEGSGSRFTPTGSIEVQFNRNLPISASINNFNLDHFLIRRYIPDASQIIIKGFKPVNSVGPYIAKPQFVTSELSKGIDDYILDLTNKGLL
jgi:hypothetical protein